jgi:hypothetical protein
VTADNLSAYKTGQLDDFLDRRPKVHLHFTPTYSSWLTDAAGFVMWRQGELKTTRSKDHLEIPGTRVVLVFPLLDLSTGDAAPSLERHRQKSRFSSVCPYALSIELSE